MALLLLVVEVVDDVFGTSIALEVEVPGAEVLG